MTHTALRQYPTPHQVKSSDQAIFPFISQFSHDESLCFVLFLIFFLIYHQICHTVLRWNFLEYSSDSLMSNHLQSQKCCLVVHDSPHVSLYLPAPHFQIFVPNFTIHHDKSAVSAFCFKLRCCTQTPSAFHRPPSPAYLRILG